MKDNLMIALQALESRISHDESVSRFSDLNKIKDRCYEVTGYRNHFVWHIYFNLDKFRDDDVIFNPYDIQNINSIITFSDIMDMIFDELQALTGIDSLDLKVIMNNFIVGKEEQQKKSYN